MEGIPLPADQENSSFNSITLRPFQLSDIDDYMVWATDDLASHFCGWETFTRKEDVLDYLQNTVLPHPWFRAICIRDRPIGTISIKPGSTHADRCKGELGYVLGSNFWGRGIATAAVKMVMSSIFSEWPHLERLEALVDVHNPRSQRVLEKAGFQREGLLRKYLIQKGRTKDMVMYSFLSTDPIPELQKKG